MHIGSIAQPAGFHHMMADGTGNEVVTVGIGSWNKEFGHSPSDWSALEMLAQRPPAEVVDVVEFLIWTIEKRYVFLHPVGGILVGNVGHGCCPRFGVKGIEGFLVSRKTVSVIRKNVVGKHGGLLRSGRACFQTIILVHKQVAAMTGRDGSIAFMEREGTISHWSANDVGDMKASRRVEFVSMRHIEILVGRCLVVGL